MFLKPFGDAAVEANDGLVGVDLRAHFIKQQAAAVAHLSEGRSKGQSVNRAERSGALSRRGD